MVLKLAADKYRKYLLNLVLIIKKINIENHYSVTVVRPRPTFWTNRSKRASSALFKMNYKLYHRLLHAHTYSVSKYTDDFNDILFYK